MTLRKRFSLVEARRGDAHSTSEITERCAFVALSPEEFSRRLDGRDDIEFAWKPHTCSALFHTTHYITLTPDLSPTGVDDRHRTACRRRRCANDLAEHIATRA